MPQQSPMLQQDLQTKAPRARNTDAAVAERWTTALSEYEQIYDVPEPALASIKFSIRIPPNSGLRRCAVCDSLFQASGPTGFAGEVAICDHCLFRGEPQLGMAVGLIAAARSFAGAHKTIFASFLQSLLQLGAFARLYEAFACRFGPPRPFIVPGFPEAPPGGTSG